MIVYKCREMTFSMGYKVFISFKRNALDGSGITRDYVLAADLHRSLKDKGIETFFSEKDLSTSDFRDEIDEALDEAEILVVVGTNKDHLESKNVKYEWRSFQEDLLGGYKPNGQIYTYIEGMKQEQLPRALRLKQSFFSEQKETLVRFIMDNLGITDSPANAKTTQNTTAKPASQPAPQPQPVKKTPPAPSKSYRVGDRIPFGQYPQGANGEMQPLMWRVLAVENGRALLITDKLIDCVKYNEKRLDVTWETCTLRKWMNNDFISKAFKSNQLAQIVTVTNQNPKNPQYGTKGGNATQDRIFALSIDEANKYFRDDDDSMAAPTGYAKKQGCYVSSDYLLPSGEKTGWWWLRSPGNYSDLAARVGLDGYIFRRGDCVSRSDVAVRPAFWLNL